MESEKLIYSEYVSKVKLKYPTDIKNQIKYSEKIMPGNMYTKFIIELLKEPTFEMTYDMKFAPVQVENLLRAMSYMIDCFEEDLDDSKFNYIKTNLRPFFKALYEQVK